MASIRKSWLWPAVLFLLLGGWMLELSRSASPALFGLYLSLGAWLLVLGFIVVPLLALRRRHLARERLSPPDEVFDDQRRSVSKRAPKAADKRPS